MRIAQGTTCDSVVWIQREVLPVSNISFVRFIVYEHVDGETVPHSMPFDKLQDAVEYYRMLI